MAKDANIMKETPCLWNQC